MTTKRKARGAKVRQCAGYLCHKVIRKGESYCRYHAQFYPSLSKREAGEQFEGEGACGDE